MTKDSLFSYLLWGNLTYAQSVWAYALFSNPETLVSNNRNIHHPATTKTGLKLNLLMYIRELNITVLLNCIKSTIVVIMVKIRVISDISIQQMLIIWKLFDEPSNSWMEGSYSFWADFTINPLLSFWIQSTYLVTLVEFHRWAPHGRILWGFTVLRRHFDLTKTQTSKCLNGGPHMYQEYNGQLPQNSTGISSSWVMFFHR